MKYLVVAAVLAVTAVASAAPPVELFAQRNDVSDLKISPDGRYLSMLVPEKDMWALTVVPLADPKKTVKILPWNIAGVADYRWAGSSRLIAELAEPFDLIDEPQATGELMGVNPDGTELTYLFGYRGSKIASRMPQVGTTYGSAEIVATPLPDPQHAIVSVVTWDNINADNESFETFKLNVTNGLLDNMHAAPQLGYTEFLADWNGNIRYALTRDIHENVLTFARNVDGDWQAVNSGKLEHARVHPIAMSKDGSTAYLRSNEGGDKLCLIQHNLTSGERKNLSCSDAADVDHAILSYDRQKPIAAVYTDDRTRVILLNPDDPDAALLAVLQKAFPGQVVEPISATADGTKEVLAVYSDRNPGDYYLFDASTKKVQYLMSRRNGIDPNQMAERRPISFKARDGETLHGYLTLPPGLPEKNLPLVVHPHGGPFEIRDGWRWEADPELLATHGYAVLQVNYRGSGGFGEKFFEAGKQRWDSIMIDDITDGARWAVAQGTADGNRLCIYGASYGGYAALMSAVREPSLYRCVIDYAGVYDLAIQRFWSDTARSRIGRTYIDEFIGATPERLHQASPVAYIDRLKAAIMIVHGEEDERVPYKQAKALRAALDHRHYPYEWLVKAGEAHGFAMPANRLELYTKLLAFLDKNIGAGASGGAAPAASTPVTPSVPEAAPSPPIVTGTSRARAH